MREALVLNRVRAINVIRCLGIVHDTLTGYPKYLVLELAASNLDEWLKDLKRPLTLREYRKLCKDILAGINAMHSTKPDPIVHRDIKPMNILVIPDAVVQEMVAAGEANDGVSFTCKLGDLGEAYLLVTGRATVSAGTPLFVAPEVGHADYNELVDMFSVGVVMAYVARKFVLGPAAFELTVANRMDMCRDVVKEFQTLSPSMAKVIRGCVQVDPKTRMCAADAFQLVVRAALLLLLLLLLLLRACL